MNPVHFSKIAWLPRLNFGRGFGEDSRISNDPKEHSGEDKRLSRSIALHKGWDGQWPATVIPMRDEWMEEVMAFRKNALEQALANVGASLQADIWAAFHTLRFGEPDKLIVPEFLGATGNRRSMILPHSVILALTSSEEGMPGPLSRQESESIEGWISRVFNLNIPVNFKDISSENDILMVQIRENALGAEGKKEVSPTVNLRNARKMIEAGMRQADVQREFGSIGQKLYGINVLDMQVADLNLLERINADEKTMPDAIPFGKLPNNLTNIIAATSIDPEAIDKYNEKAPEKLRLSRMTTAVEVNEWLKKIVDGKKAAPVMNAEGLDNAMRRFKDNPLVVSALLAAKHNDASKYLSDATALNTPVKTLSELRAMPETFDSATRLLVAVKETPTLAAQIEPYVKMPALIPEVSVAQALSTLREDAVSYGQVVELITELAGMPADKRKVPALKHGRKTA